MNILQYLLVTIGFIIIIMGFEYKKISNSKEINEYKLTLLSRFFIISGIIFEIFVILIYPRLQLSQEQVVPVLFIVFAVFLLIKSSIAKLSIKKK